VAGNCGRHEEKSCDGCRDENAALVHTLPLSPDCRLVSWMRVDVRADPSIQLTLGATGTGRNTTFGLRGVPGLAFQLRCAEHTVLKLTLLVLLLVSPPCDWVFHEVG
jgi:hypothetical protein